jgi:hypothetical protein
MQYSDYIFCSFMRISVCIHPIQSSEHRTIKRTQNHKHTPRSYPGLSPGFLAWGYFSILRTSSPCIEPGDLPLLKEAMSLHRLILRLKDGENQTISGQTPNRRVSVSSGRFPDLRLATYPDYLRCALVIRYFVRNPGFPLCRFHLHFGATLRLESHRSPPVGQDPVPEGVAHKPSLTRR